MEDLVLIVWILFSISSIIQVFKYPMEACLLYRASIFVVVSLRCQIFYSAYIHHLSYGGDDSLWQIIDETTPRSTRAYASVASWEWWLAKPWSSTRWPSGRRGRAGWRDCGSRCFCRRPPPWSTAATRHVSDLLLRTPSTTPPRCCLPNLCLPARSLSSSIYSFQISFLSIALIV
jgi:hypothetical protein